jgi:hypothetical protein
MWGRATPTSRTSAKAPTAWCGECPRPPASRAALGHPTAWGCSGRSRGLSRVLASGAKKTPTAGFSLVRARGSSGGALGRFSFSGVGRPFLSRPSLTSGEGSRGRTPDPGDPRVGLGRGFSSLDPREENGSVPRSSRSSF